MLLSSFTHSSGKFVAEQWNGKIRISDSEIELSMSLSVAEAAQLRDVLNEVLRGEQEKVAAPELLESLLDLVAMADFVAQREPGMDDLKARIADARAAIAKEVTP